MPLLPAVRGLATVALLKAHFDQGNDHIGMFLPFLLDTARHMQVTNADAETIKNAIAERHGLAIPTPTLRTLLKRARRHGISREGGHYFIRHSDLPDTGIEQRRAILSQEHNALAKEFIVFAESKGTTIDTTDTALALIFKFVAQDEMELLLEDSPAVLARQLDKPGKRESHLTARFLTHVALKDQLLTGYIERLLEGFVLQHTLLLSDVNAVRSRFDNLSVYLDSGVLFGAIGLLGVANRAMSVEVLDLLRRSGARLGVFGVTILEMRRILDLYAAKLTTNEGRRSLRQTPLTRHILTSRMTASDMKQTSVLLDTTLRGIGVLPSSRPTRTNTFTLDEQDLSERLSAGGRLGDRPIEPRVVHDVDCVAAVLTLRRGRVSPELSRSHAVFVTGSSIVLQTTRRWCSDQGLAGVPPIVHWNTIANLAWLKRPAHSVTSKVHQLTALCGAALQPDRETWRLFLDHLKKLEHSKELDSDESVAILVSSLTEQLLMDLEDDGDLDSNSLDEVVDRVRKRYAGQAEKEIAAVKAEARISSQKLDELQRGQADLADIVGRRGSWAIIVIVGIVVVLSLVYLTKFTTTAITIATLVSGGSLLGLRRRLMYRLSSWTRRTLGARSRTTESEGE